MNAFNIYLAGVGGQGIGLLSEILLRSADYAGFKVKAVDTHGLAQRGGIVISNLRLGEGVHSPLIARNEADLVIALELHEAIRGANTFLKDGGTLIYYNTVWQPLDVRLNLAEPVSINTISRQCRKRNIKEMGVVKADLVGSRRQNIVVLANIDKHNLIPGIQKKHYLQAMDDLLHGRRFKENVKLFEEERQ